MSIERTVVFEPDGWEMLGEHLAGDSYRVIGRHHGVSHEQARKLVQRQSTALVNEVEMSLYTAAKLEAMGREDEAAWPCLVVPHQPGDGWQRSLGLLQHVVDRLRARAVAVLVHTRPTPNGSVFMLTLEGAS